MSTVCLDCKKEKRILGRGLCSGCYQKHRTAGTLDAQFPLAGVVPPTDPVSHPPVASHPADESLESGLDALLGTSSATVVEIRPEIAVQMGKAGITDADVNDLLELLFAGRLLRRAA